MPHIAYNFFCCNSVLVDYQTMSASERIFENLNALGLNSQQLLCQMIHLLGQVGASSDSDSELDIQRLNSKLRWV